MLLAVFFFELLWVVCVRITSFGTKTVIIVLVVNIVGKRGGTRLIKLQEPDILQSLMSKFVGQPDLWIAWWPLGEGSQAKHERMAQLDYQAGVGSIDFKDARRFPTNHHAYHWRGHFVHWRFASLQATWLA